MTWWLRGGRWIRAPRRPARVPARPFLHAPRQPSQPTPGRALLALLQAVVRVAKCKAFGHTFEHLIVPVSVEAFERFGEMPYYAQYRLMFENIIRVGRMVETVPTQPRCRRCYVSPPLPPARVA